MIRPIRATVVALLVLHVTCLAAWAGLRDDVERLVRMAPLKGAKVAVSIRDCSSGASLVAVNADAQMAPASNMKLLTTGSALHALGAKFEFSTGLILDGDRLIVLGDGDPALGDPELLSDMSINGKQGVDVETFLNLWVQPVVDSGVKTISEIVVDDRIFDREFVHPTWPADQLNNRYCAQISGLNFHANVLHFFPRPRPNEPPLIGDSRPAAPWLKVSNSAYSRDGINDKNDSWIARRPGTNEMTLRGNVRFPYKASVPVTVHNMPEFFAQILADRLTKAGIAVGGHRESLRDDPPSTGQKIGPAITTPISTILKRCNTDSENLYAECLLKRIGHALTGEPGSWINGPAIMRRIIHERLDNPSLASGIIISDGSGLSADNRVTAGAMTAWLNSFANDETLGPVFIESLAVAGQSGTLQKRYADSKKLHGAVVQAKTGYISQVSCLSGFVTMSDGRRRAFSVLVNGLKDPSCVPLAKKLQDEIVCSIADDLADTPATALGGD